MMNEVRRISVERFEAQFEALPAEAKKGWEWRELMGLTGFRGALLEAADLFDEMNIFELDEDLNLVVYEGTEEISEENEAKGEGLERFSELEYKRLQAQTGWIYDTQGTVHLKPSSSGFEIRAGVRGGKRVVVFYQNPSVDDFSSKERRLLRIPLNDLKASQ